MDIKIREAHEKDAEAITALKETVWPDQAADRALARQALCDPQHTAHVAVHQDRIIGFVDGFLTHTQVGLARWEVDLLAVHPASRGQRIGERLVHASVSAGKDKAAAFARALIRPVNTASERTFERCDFQPENGTCTLYLSSKSAKTAFPQPDWLHLIPVNTLNYRGLWMEGGMTQEGFTAAQAARQRDGRDVVGAVVPVYLQESNQAALAAGFEPAAEYRWWYYNLDGNFSILDHILKEEEV